MVNISVMYGMYGNKPGARFDHACYCDQHMPMAHAKLGAAFKSSAVDNTNQPPMKQIGDVVFG